MAYQIKRDPDGTLCLYDGGLVVEKFARSEKDKAETRLNELNAQASEAAKQERQAKKQDTKPAKRRRSIRTKQTADGLFLAYDLVVPWVEGYGTTRDEAKANARAAAEAEKLRVTNKEESWRLGNPEGYKAAEETIAKIKAGVPAIERRYSCRDYYPMEEYGFNKPFDLADRLIGLLETYKRNKAQPPMKESLDEHERRLTEIKKTSSLANATVMEISWLAMGGYRLHRDPETGREKHALQRAVRKLEAAPRKEGGGGRYLTAEAILARGLAGTYYHGTGKLPLTGPPGQFRGPYARFAHECLALLNIAVKDATLRDQANWKHTYFKTREEERNNAREKREP